MGSLGSALFLLVATPVLAGASDTSTMTSATCPVTVAAEQPFREPSPSSASQFWYGDEALAVLLRAGGWWRGMDTKHRYRTKLVWWRQGYDGRSGSWPSLTVTGKRLDASAPPADVSRATGAYHSDFGGWAMMVAVEFPTSGCWELTGEYQGHALSFIVQVGP